MVWERKGKDRAGEGEESMESAYRAALARLPGMSVLSLPKLISLAGGSRELWEILARGGERAAALAGRDRAIAWARACDEKEPAEVLEELGRAGIRVIVPGDGLYPPLLASIYDPPAVLFARGKVPEADRPYVAVVGSRRASGYGVFVAMTLGKELARHGIAVVSGAAYGVDGKAHQGCLRSGGYTVAVLGCGVDRVYPPGHASLLRQVAEQGCVLSEFPPGTKPLPWHFPYRNRIIAGLSHAVVVVEASRKSGALITAEIALEEGREVMAVPGPIGNPLSLGTNGLIQKGAKLVMEIGDICEELPWDVLSMLNPGLRGEKAPPRADDGEDALSEVETACLELLRGGPCSLDWLAAKTGQPAGELLSCLSSLTLRGLVGEEAGGRYMALPIMGETGERLI